MSVLDIKLFPTHGPYIELASLPEAILEEESRWPRRALYEQHIFFAWADDLVWTMCSVSQSELFFDPYEYIEYRKTQEIYRFSAQILSWASRMASIPEPYFDSKISIYQNSLADMDCRTGRHLKADMIETLLFIAEQVNDVIRDGRCLGVVGI